MLCLTRKVGEKIVINENIVLVVMEIRPGRVHLGIDAPKDVPIYRHEIAKKREPTDFTKEDR